MRVITAEFLAKETFDLDYLAGEAVSCEEFFDLVHAEKVPMVFVGRTDDVVRNFVHLKKMSADRAARDAAEFFDCGVEAFDGKMFKEIMNEQEIEGDIRSLEQRIQSMLGEAVR